MSIAPPVDNLFIGRDHNGYRMTPEEFDSVGEGDYDPDYRYELIDGVLIVNAFPLPAERGPNQELGYLLLDYKYQHLHGSTLDDTLEEEYVRTSKSRRRADRVIWAGLGRHPDYRNDLPTIVVEFVSAGRRSWRRDYVEKRDEYRELGICEYWIFDRFQRRLTVFRTSDGKEEELTIAEDDVYTTTLLPGFELPIQRILKVADEWSEN